MIGAIAGDIIGSTSSQDRIPIDSLPLFPRGCHFTDNSVLIVALADAILNEVAFDQKLEEYARLYPEVGIEDVRYRYGTRELQAYSHLAERAAAWAIPLGYAYADLETVLREAERSVELTRYYPAGVKMAQVVAAAVFLARTGKTKDEILNYIEKTLRYSLMPTFDPIEGRRDQGRGIGGLDCVQVALNAFQMASDFEETVRNAVLLGEEGSASAACIAGGIAEAFYGGIPDAIKERAYAILDARLRSVCRKFRAKYLQRGEEKELEIAGKKAGKGLDWGKTPILGARAVFWAWQPALIGGLLAIFGLVQNENTPEDWLGSIANAVRDAGKAFLQLVWSPETMGSAITSLLLSIVLLFSTWALFSYHRLHFQDHADAGDEAITVGMRNTHEIAHTGLFLAFFIALFGGLVGGASILHLLYLGIARLVAGG